MLKHSFTRMTRLASPFPCVLICGSKAIRISAKVDTGAAVCLFSHEDGLKLGLPVTQGMPSCCRASVARWKLSVMKSLPDWYPGFSKPRVLAQYPGLPRNILGRQGWLRNLRLAVIDYDNLLYLGAYDS